MASFKPPYKHHGKPYAASYSHSQQNPRCSTRSSSKRPMPSAIPQALEKAQSQRKKRATLDLRNHTPPTHEPITPNSAVLSSQSKVRGDSVSVAQGDLDAKEKVDDDEADALSEIVMAIDMRDRGTVGCCYYVAREEALYFMDDVKSGGVDVIETLKLYAQPTIILISSKIDEVVHEQLDPDSGGRSTANGNDDRFRLPYLVEVRPSQEFAYEGGKRKLVDIPMENDYGSQVAFLTPGEDGSYKFREQGDEVGFSNRQGKLLRLCAWINLESRLSIGCAGAVLTYLSRRRAAEYLPRDMNAHGVFQVTKIETFSLKEYMYINADALSSLQIMQAETHPHSHNQGPNNAASGSKEGLSVYGLFHHFARTPQGKALLRQYFLRPTLDLDVIKERQNTISVFLRPDNEVQFEALCNCFPPIKNMKTVMIHLRKGISNGAIKGGGMKSGVWSVLRAFTFHTLGIRSTFLEFLDAENLLIRNKVLEKFDLPQISNIGKMLVEIIDFKESANMHRTVVKAGVDDHLDEIKRNYAGVEDFLNQTSLNIADSIPVPFSLDLNVIFFPQIGFLISMPVDPETGLSNYHGQDGQEWDQVFSTAARVYYKDYHMIELDETIGDIYAQICDREIEIIHDLAQEILKYEIMLCTVSDICGELDCLLALTQGARLYKLSRPQVILDNVIQIKDGRHLLQERTVASYIANDTFLAGGLGNPNAYPAPGLTLGPSRQSTGTVLDHGPSMLMMTGPNYSGKSVYLKQIALIVYMAHVGCFVPAERAVIGLTDKILTRIATIETVSRAQSAFMIDLQQISSAINLATSRSLIIIDEFGKGTDSSDGAGLACGVFEYLLSLGDERPKVLGATHFHEIFENGFLAPQTDLAFGHMEVRVDIKAADIEHQITYLYNFRSGRSISSFGTACAAIHGIEPAIVARADELILLEARGEDLVAACAKISERDAADLEAAQEAARMLLSWELDEEGGEHQDWKAELVQLLAESTLYSTADLRNATTIDITKPTRGTGTTSGIFQ